MGVAVRGGRLGVIRSPPASAAFAKTTFPMKARREEEAIIADGPRERGGRDGRGFGSGAGRNRADAGAQLAGCRVTARLQPQLKCRVFEEEGRKIGLLRHQVKVYRRSLHVGSKEPLKGPCSVHI